MGGHYLAHRPDYFGGTAMIYLSGKISHPDPVIQEHNLEVFNILANQMREKGVQVFNPAELETPDYVWEDYLARDVLWITQNKPVLYQMRGWEESLGARLEYKLALLLGLRVVQEGEVGFEELVGC